MIVYVSIGNSDDKLTQQQWSHFVADVRDAIEYHAERIHGAWLSAPDAPWQNACWCFEPRATWELKLRGQLAVLAGAYQQDSIAWAEATTDFLGPA